jgi:DNA-binding transcriptional regulator YdaS (Cro superfamily)
MAGLVAQAPRQAFPVRLQLMLAEAVVAAAALVAALVARAGLGEAARAEVAPQIMLERQELSILAAQAAVAEMLADPAQQAAPVS